MGVSSLQKNPGGNRRAGTEDDLGGRMQIATMLAEKRHEADSKWEDFPKNFNELILHSISFSRVHKPDI